MNIIKDLLSLLEQSKRILGTLSKPEENEFLQLSKIIILMIIATGLIGLIVAFIVSIDAFIFSR
ncbi:MAG: protein translocase SEC61 complex subunit gamma [Candidatus Micrarchaeota archaeon]|nr:protein translocase SEC61 complex subunit gamma [Candidatus Micrarchaeota archaeon]